jgi:membrane protein DedA with SNARE-associated domain
VEDFISNIMSLDPLLVYIAVASIAYIENIFPPFPSDVVVVAAGSLIGIGAVNFTLALVLATVGSTLGFVTMYAIGHWFGERIVEAGKFKFLPVESIRKVEEWFRRYGYGVIVANRFLAGTRAVVSFFAGLSSLRLSMTVILSFLSALVWNAILLYAGKKLGENWEDILFYLETYSKAVTFLIVVVVIVVVIQLFSRKNSNGSQPRGEQPPSTKSGA